MAHLRRGGVDVGATSVTLKVGTGAETDRERQGHFVTGLLVRHPRQMAGQGFGDKGSALTSFLRDTFHLKPEPRSRGKMKLTLRGTSVSPTFSTWGRDTGPVTSSAGHLSNRDVNIPRQRRRRYPVGVLQRDVLWEVQVMSGVLPKAIWLT